MLYPPVPRGIINWCQTELRYQIPQHMLPYHIVLYRILPYYVVS
jgi:hypothetical protein